MAGNTGLTARSLPGRTAMRYNFRPRQPGGRVFLTSTRPNSGRGYHLNLGRGRRRRGRTGGGVGKRLEPEIFPPRTVATRFKGYIWFFPRTTPGSICKQNNLNKWARRRGGLTSVPNKVAAALLGTFRIRLGGVTPPLTNCGRKHKPPFWFSFTAARPPSLWRAPGGTRNLHPAVHITRMRLSELFPGFSTPRRTSFSRPVPVWVFFFFDETRRKTRTAGRFAACCSGARFRARPHQDVQTSLPVRWSPETTTRRINQERFDRRWRPEFGGLANWFFLTPTTLTQGKGPWRINMATDFCPTRGKRVPPLVFPFDSAKTRLDNRGPLDPPGRTDFPWLEAQVPDPPTYLSWPRAIGLGIFYGSRRHAPQVRISVRVSASYVHRTPSCHVPIRTYPGVGFFNAG